MKLYTYLDFRIFRYCFFFLLLIHILNDFQTECEELFHSLYFSAAVNARFYLLNIHENKAVLRSE